MKINSTDVVRLLRLFDQADEDLNSSQIKQLKSYNPSPTNLLVVFRRGQRQYALLSDEVTDDQVSDISAMIAKVLPGRQLKIIRNPLEADEQYAVPYQGKQWYLALVDGQKVRLDSHIASLRPDYSRSSWQHFIKLGHVKVDDQIVKSPKTLIDSGQEVTVQLPEPDTEDVDLKIIYQDEDMLVVNKPAGVLTHPKNQRDDEFSVERFLKNRLRDPSGLAEEQRFGIVHRLDRDTSGLLVCAKNLASFEHLKNQFAQRLVKKTYRAITTSQPKQPKAVIDIPIARSNSQPGKFIASSNGKPAQTLYEVEQTVGEYALVKLQPKTGRTHQLRVHLTYIGAPILGDRLYNSEHPADRMYLHAQQLEITAPDGKKHCFEAKLPPEFEEKLSRD